MKVSCEKDYNMEFVRAATLLLNHTRLFKRNKSFLNFSLPKNQIQTESYRLNRKGSHLFPKYMNTGRAIKMLF